MIDYNQNTCYWLFFMAYSNFYARAYTAFQNSLDSLATLWQTPPVRIYLISIGLLQALVWWQAINIYQKVSGNLLILHYNIDFGVDLIGAPPKIFYYPLASLLLALLNIALATTFINRKYFRPLMHMLLLAAAVFTIFLSLALLTIYTVNFR